MSFTKLVYNEITQKFYPEKEVDAFGPLVTEAGAATLTNKTLTGPIINGQTGTVNLVTYTGDAAITLVSQVALLTKGSAAAMTVAAPGAAGVGARITITSGSNFAHVVTFTGGTLGDGTTGLNTTVTMSAFIGSTITVIGNTATQWIVESQNNLTSIA
jgi:hypothetical protein